MVLGIAKEHPILDRLFNNKKYDGKFIWLKKLI